MFFQNINYITIVIAGVVSMGIGFAWYSKAIFGQRFLKEVCPSPEEIAKAGEGMSKADMVKSYGTSFVLALITAFILSSLLNSLVVVGIWGVIVLAVLMWLAFSVPTGITLVLYGKRDSWALFAINSGYYLVTIVVSALIVAIFG